MLVKALPEVSDKYGETVCCAGITAEGTWRRQFPIRFRSLDTKFRRWQWIEYDWRKPKNDPRPESRRVQEDTISTHGSLTKSKRSAFLAPHIRTSIADAALRGETLALVRPKNLKFKWKRKSDSEIEEERESYARAAAQTSFFDEDLKALNPCPVAFFYQYEDLDGRHEHRCLDWETSATYYRLIKTNSESEALERMEFIFGEQYPKDGVVFALGTHSRYPKTWLLVGVVRLDEHDEMFLNFFDS